MNTFIVVITENLCKVIEVSAKDSREAGRIVRRGL